MKRTNDSNKPFDLLHFGSNVASKLTSNHKCSRLHKENDRNNFYLTNKNGIRMFHFYSKVLNKTTLWTIRMQSMKSNTSSHLAHHLQVDVFRFGFHLLASNSRNTSQQRYKQIIKRKNTSISTRNLVNYLVFFRHFRFSFRGGIEGWTRKVLWDTNFRFAKAFG